jgi:hypothetical protein
MPVLKTRAARRGTKYLRRQLPGMRPLGPAFRTLNVRALQYYSLLFAMAPHCAHCQYHVLGHGVEAGGKIYSCSHVQAVRVSRA